jgi:hypothetical protein
MPFLEEILHLCSRVGGVERQKHGTGAHRGEVQGNGLHRLGHLYRHPIAGFDALRLQQAGQPAAQIDQLRVGPVVTVGHPQQDP